MELRCIHDGISMARRFQNSMAYSSKSLAGFTRTLHSCLYPLIRAFLNLSLASPAPFVSLYISFPVITARLSPLMLLIIQSAC